MRPKKGGSPLKHRLISLILCLILAGSALLAASCSGSPTGAAPDHNTTSAPAATETPSSAAPAESSTEKPGATPTEIERPSEPSEITPSGSSRAEEEPAPPSGREITVEYTNQTLLSEEKAHFLEQYLKALAFDEDPSGAAYIAEEVRLSWDFLPYGGRDFSVNIVWDGDDEFAVTASRRSGKPIDDGLRYDFLVCRRTWESWKVVKDIYSYQWMMCDVENETTEVLRDIFQKARAARPVTEEERKAAEEAALDFVTDVLQYGQNSATKNYFRATLNTIYDAEWEAVYLPRVMSWFSDYRNPAVLFYVYQYYGGSLNHYTTYVTLEDGKWVARWLINQPDPEPPAGAPTEKSR